MCCSPSLSLDPHLDTADCLRSVGVLSHFAGLKRKSSFSAPHASGWLLLSLLLGLPFLRTLPFLVSPLLPPHPAGKAFFITSKAVFSPSLLHTHHCWPRHPDLEHPFFVFTQPARSFPRPVSPATEGTGSVHLPFRRLGSPFAHKVS